MKRQICRWWLLALALIPSFAAAQNFPARPVRIVIPYPPAGGVDSLQSLAAHLPGFSFEGGWGGLYSAPALRGQNQSTLLALDAVGMFIDGGYQANRDAADAEPLDLERIEVVEGPQSALFGHSSFAGLIHFIPAEPTEPTRLTLELLDALRKEFGIDAKRIYITGLSMGGFGTWDMIARRPDYFAAAVPICGGGKPETAALFKDVPIHCYHGAKDPAVPQKQSDDMIEALKKAGGKPEYTVFPDAAHDSWTAAYADPKLYDWMLAQKKAAK